MGQLVNITDVTSATAATIGVDALTGWTRVISPSQDLPTGSVSTAYLCQTDDAVAPTVRLDNTATVFGVLVTLTIGAVTGTYTLGETVTQTGSGATGVFVSVNGTTITLRYSAGTFNASGVLTGGTSGATSTPSALLSAATGTRQTYQRVSYMVRLIKTNNEVGTAPSTATLFTLTDSVGGAGYYFGRTRVAYTAPSASSPDLSRYTPSIGGVCAYLDSSAGYYGVEGGIGLTEASNMFRSSTGSAAAPSGGTYQPTLPIGQWMRLSYVWDNAARRGYFTLNGYVCGFFSYGAARGEVAFRIGAITGTFQVGETVTQSGTGATGTYQAGLTSVTAALTRVSGTFNGTGVLTGGTSGATVTPSAITTETTGAIPATVWTATFPAWAGFRWHLCEMSSWGDTDIANDTGLTPISDSRNWRTWGLSPTFMDVPAGATGGAVLRSLVTANCTRSYIPYSLVTGNRPLRERLRITTTSSSASTASFAVANAPIEWNEDDLFTVCTNIRLGSPNSASNGNTWVWSGQFTGIFPSFNIAYSSGAYRMTDAVGTELGSWAINELVQIVWTLNRNGTCAVTVFNQSKDSTATAPTSVNAALAGSDAVPTTTFGFVGNFSATVSGDLAEMEMWEGYRNFAFLVADSYEEAALQGTAAYNVSTFSTAYRATVNRSSLLNISDNSADCNPHGCMTFPQGPQYPRWAFSGAWGRSGKKWSDWVTTSLPGLNCLQGATCVLLAGLANDMNTATNSATSIAVAADLATKTTTAARYFLDRNGRFIWMRPTFPYYRPNSSYPASPFAGQWPYDCFVRSLSAITTALATVQRTHPKGYRCVIADVGMVDFADGVHWGSEGSVPAFVNAGNSIAEALGESYPQGSTSAIPGAANIGTITKKKLIVIQG